MTVRALEEPGRTAGYKAVTVWGPRAEVARWLEITTGIEWVSPPQPHGSGVLVRVQIRRQIPQARPARAALPPARRAVIEPWWRQPDKVVLAGLAAGVALGAVGLLVWLVVSAVAAGIRWLADNWPLVVAIAVAALAAGTLLRRLFRATSTGGGTGCPGLHCTGCTHH